MSSTSELRQRKGGASKEAEGLLESKPSPSSDPPISEIEPVVDGDDGERKDSDEEVENPAAAKDALIKEGIAQASISGEFWMVIAALVLCFGAIKYLERLPDGPSKRVFTKEELKKYSAENGGPVYLAIMGEVFDVSKGEKYYGKGGGYDFFTGVDGSRAYITGDFKDNLVDNLEGFTPEEFKALVEWRNFYRDSDDYIFVGKVDGAFYDSKGQPTAALTFAEEQAEEGKRVQKLKEEAKKKYPSCNSRWSQSKGGEVWCDHGYPRRILEQIPGAKPLSRCACFNETGHSDVRKLYDNCPPDAQRCKTQRPKKEEAKGNEGVKAAS